MSLRGMLVVPLVALLVGYALDRVTPPTHLVTETRLYREDWFGLRSAVQHAHEHVLWCLSGSVSRLKRLRDTAVSVVAGSLSADGQEREGRVGDVKGSAGDMKGRVGDVKGSAGDVKGRSGDVKGRTGHGTVTRLFTAEELAEHDGSATHKGPLLALLGHVFDVSAGRQHYGPGGGYAFFAGRDASRAFVSGDFSPAGLTDDVSGLTPRDRLGLDDWLRFYRKDYTAVGRLVGRFFDENGDETEQQRAWLRELVEARRLQRQDNDEKLSFPPCNSEWSEARGGRVYCSDRSGGVHRSWVGVPRQLFSGGHKRCTCVRERGAPSHGVDTGTDRGDLDHPQLAQYDGCDDHSVSCQIKP